MTAKKGNTKKAQKQKSTSYKIGSKIGHVAAGLITGKDKLVQMADGAFDSVKSLIGNVGAAKKATQKKSVKSVSKKVVKKESGTSVKKQANATIKQNISPAKKKTKPAVVKKAAPIKKTVKPTTAKKTAALKKINT